MASRCLKTSPSYIVSVSNYISNWIINERCDSTSVKTVVISFRSRSIIHHRQEKIEIQLTIFSTKLLIGKAKFILEQFNLKIYIFFVRRYNIGSHLQRARRFKSNSCYYMRRCFAQHGGLKGNI